MACLPLDEIEELALCSCCRRAFDEGERVPKLLACKHHFCLSCTRGALAGGPGEARCPHCGKRTRLAGGAAALPTHAAVLALALRAAPPPWCAACAAPARPACRAHEHALRPLAALRRDARLLRAELWRLSARRRDLLLRALDAAASLRARLVAELALPAPPGPSSCTLPAAASERERLRVAHGTSALQERLDDLVRAAPAPFDFDRLRRALAAPPPAIDPAVEPEPLLLLANFCTAALFARGWHGDGEVEGDFGDPLPPPLAGSFPLFFFDLEVDGAAAGRVVVEVRDDVAPRMARNFAALATGELGVGYRGCTVFQCWDSESVITGDFELNNGRGGRSVFEESYFMPDDTKMAAVRGAVGMRRSQKRHDNLGLVGSQFRITLREMRGFTAIFGFVLEGLELVDKLSRTGDGAGKPHSSIQIASCGKLN